MLNISIWWEALTMPLKIYWVIAIPATLLFIIQLVMTFVGGDLSDAEAMGDSDAAVEGDHGIEFQFITLKNLIAFFTIFGWTGIACLNSGVNVGLSALISAVAGLIMMAIMTTIIWLMGKLTHDGSLKLTNAIGKFGTVYIPIPAKRTGMGQVQIKVQGLQTLDAMTDSDESFKTGAVVEVCDVIDGGILLVK
ncbi:MAG: hypothetical protein FWG22_01570 [Prolixibacteraceae bacterium]|nr:hypothetical protein [Prolixibacteraceae bacterium]